MGYPTPVFWGFSDGSAGKEFACNAGDLGSIPGLGRPLEKGTATHSSILSTKLMMWLVFQLRNWWKWHSCLFSPEQWPSDLRVFQNHLEHLLEDRLLTPPLRLSDSVY